MVDYDEDDPDDYCVINRDVQISSTESGITQPKPSMAYYGDGGMSQELVFSLHAKS